jgi:tRNA G46 methylase TrmB
MLHLARKALGEHETGAKPDHGDYSRHQLSECKLLLRTLEEVLEGGLREVKGAFKKFLYFGPQLQGSRDPRPWATLARYGLGRVEYEKYFFPNTSKLRVRALMGRAAPISIELACGSGEFLCEQAKSSKGTLWLGFELRYDRCFEAWFNAIFVNKLRNVYILGGDAQRILKDHLTPRSPLLRNFCTSAYVNFPEPPIWQHSLTAQARSTCSSHLLNDGFLKHLTSDIMADGGGGSTLRIISDNLQYLLRVHSSLGPLVLAQGEGNFELGEVELATERAVSVFDRFFRNGKKVKRYGLTLRKGAGRGSE